MHPRLLVVTLVGSALVLSCNESKSPTDIPEASALKPAAPTTVTGVNLRAFTAPKMSANAIAMLVSAAPHNPRSQAGQPVVCFDGVTDGGFGGTCQRFSPTKDGAELKTNGGDPRGEYAGVFGAQGVRNKLIGNVIELSFAYAGGPNVGGSPRWSIPISEDGDGVFEPPVPDPLHPGQFLPGPNEEFAFIAANRCNDGDENVGFLDGNDDPTCLIDHKGVAYANWAAFVSAHPTWRVAGTNVGGSATFTFVIADSPTHTVIWNLRSQ